MTDSLRLDIETQLADIEGWLHLDEAEALARAAAGLRSAEPIIVEVGSWKGRSSIALAIGLRVGGKQGTVWAIDPHQGNVEHKLRYGHVDTFDEFLYNINEAGMGDVIAPLRMPSSVARDQFEDSSVDLLFVDGSHEYEDVVLDIETWTGTLKSGSAVIFNDSSWPGVYRALTELVFCPGSGYYPVDLVRSTLLLTFDPSDSASRLGRARLRRFRLVLGTRALAGRFRHLLPPAARRAGNRLSALIVGRD